MTILSGHVSTNPAREAKERKRAKYMAYVAQQD